jgi:hypothetical protein
MSGNAFRVREMGLTIQDAIWDSLRGQFYVSTAGAAAINPNTIAHLDPTTGAMTGAVPAGTEPDALALSDDGSTLYVGVDWSAAVRRLTLPGMTTAAEYSLGRDRIFGPYYANSIEVAPGAPAIIAVIRYRYGGISPPGDGVAIFDANGPRPHVGGNLTSDPTINGNVDYLNGPLVMTMQWVGGPTSLIGNDDWTSLGQSPIF